ncbi:unnamed protein product [Caenorhabditis angaria]|uniref:Tumor protein p53-inducible protein 11 n=1 Tax=Caenorhabditis angaria TaxID=860376 RepID=A0A9P1J1Q3_9PELO|nr:unnamed protein product [Caenorhabditis angaria]
MWKPCSYLKEEVDAEKMVDTATSSPATIRHKHRLTEESRKQSASDLQSRLKTRKLLGVGELAGDNGDVYKSKISQLLGINESLYVRMPRGMCLWNTFNALYFLAIGALCLFFPVIGSRFDYGFESIVPEAKVFIRLYGVVLICFGVLFRCILQQRETRSDIATLLLVTAALHLALLIVSVAASGKITLISAAIRSFCIVGNICYHTLVDGQGGLHRQLIRVIEDLSFLTSSPIIEKKPFVEVIDTNGTATPPVQADEKKNA